MPRIKWKIEDGNEMDMEGKWRAEGGGAGGKEKVPNELV